MGSHLPYAKFSLQLVKFSLSYAYENHVWHVPICILGI